MSFYVALLGKSKLIYIVVFLHSASTAKLWACHQTTQVLYTPRKLYFFNGLISLFNGDLCKCLSSFFGITISLTEYIVSTLDRCGIKRSKLLLHSLHKVISRDRILKIKTAF